MATRKLSVWKKSLEKNLFEFDNAEQVLADSWMHTRQEAEEKAGQLRNDPDFCSLVTRVEEFFYDDEELDAEGNWRVIGKRAKFYLNGATIVTDEKLAQYGYQRDPEKYALISANVLESEWTDGGELPDWYAVDRDSIQLLSTEPIHE